MMSLAKSASIQPQNWYSDHPRKGYKSLEKLQLEDDWFEVYSLPYNVYAIYEPQHFQEVISFLIIGKRVSILFDTGMGIGDIAKIVSKLTEGKVHVINSHVHFDHIGGNAGFKNVFVYNDKTAQQRLLTGYNHEELKEHLQPYLFARDMPHWFVADNYFIKPVTPATLENNDLIDLGNRQLRVIHTPGHSPDSIMLHDITNKILFTGDTFYPAALYAHFNSSFYGVSNIEIYHQTIKMLTTFASELQYLYCSHNEPLVQPQVLYEVEHAFQSIIEGSKDFVLVDNEYRKYQYSSFSIITPDR